MTLTISELALGFVLGWIVGVLCVIVLGIVLYKQQNKSKKSSPKDIRDLMTNGKE